MKNPNELSIEDIEAMREELADREAKLRAIVGTTWGIRCTRCGLMFEDETEAEDHLNGAMCESSK